MTIRENLIALKTKIRQNFPKVDRSQSDDKIQAIQIMQELLAEALLQIERVLEQDSLPNIFRSSSAEQKEVLANLAQFCMAISLSGKNRIFAGTFFGGLLDQKSYNSLNSILKSIYDAIDYLDPRIKPLDDVFAEGSSANFPCHDLKMNLHRSFKSSLRIRIKGDEEYFGEIQDIIKELDDNYQNDDSKCAGSQPPLHPPVKEQPNLSSNSKFDPKTDSLFAGKLILAGTDKKKPLGKPSSSAKISSANLSFSDSPKNTVSLIIMTHRGLFSKPIPRRFRREKEEEKYTTPPPVIFTKRTS